MSRGVSTQSESIPVRSSTQVCSLYSPVFVCAVGCERGFYPLSITREILNIDKTSQTL